MPEKELDFVRQKLDKNRGTAFPLMCKVDATLLTYNRFFSLFDRLMRFNLYKRASVVTFYGKDVVIEADAEDANSVYVVLEGQVDYTTCKALINSTIHVTSYQAGDIMGDEFI